MFKKNTVILFQGDSITDGGRSRNDDLNHVMGHGYAYIIAARLGAEFPDLALRFYNRGCSGHRVTDLYARWKEDAINLAPDVISILVGVNDVGAAFSRNAGVSVSQYETVYRMMLKDTRQALPNTCFVLCEPFVLPVGDRKDRWDEWRAEVDMRRQAVAELADEFDAVLVRTQALLDTVSKGTGPDYWLWDGVHPMPAGHELIARTWISAVREKLQGQAQQAQSPRQ